MAIFTVPTGSDAFYTQVSDFDGIDYTLSFRYNQREDAWYFDISDNLQVELVKGIKVVCNIPLLRRFADTRLPPGELMATCLTSDASPPGLNDLGPGKRVELTYYSVEEIVKAPK